MVLLVILFALFIRLFRFPELSWFFGDQGIDFMVAQRALKEGVWPMVGPYLGVPNFFVPPTYYWLLTAFLWIGKTPEMVTISFVAMDLVTLIILYRLVRLLVDKETGLIAAGLFAMSAVMVDHGRNMWQPHPVQLFLMASLYALSLALVRRNKQGLWLIAAWGLYSVALSIYPSPIVLLPFFLYHTWQLVKHVKAVCLAILVFFSPLFRGLFLRRGMAIRPMPPSLPDLSACCGGRR